MFKYNTKDFYAAVFMENKYMWTLPNQIRYRIIAQHRDNRLMVAILDKGLCFMVSAHKIFSNSGLLNGFSQEEAALIGYIVGTETKMH